MSRKTSCKSFFAKAAVEYNLVILTEFTKKMIIAGSSSFDQIPDLEPEYAILYHMIEDRSCEFSHKASIPVFYKKDHKYFISNQLFELLQNDNKIINGSEGGLVMGKSHNDGGIPVIQKTPDGYQILVEVEGYEYIVNPISSAKFDFLLSQINDSIQPENDTVETYMFDTFIKVIDTTNSPVMLIDYANHFVINRVATKHNLLRINQINNFKWK
ncbi:hypothetical protein [Flectobacillus roseus]|uniref:hypothetical protein n=1 Tax=Flectobacillus roseus TaxID=502259 RepID=UPI0024B6990D|nr:hypothetical protein [Flectobacillus roseus]MDI9870607.1 hypothetical protein [Flectobacillus roseus]